MSLQDAYAAIISLIQQQNTSNTGKMDMENKIGDIRQKLETSDVNKLLAELNEVKADNEKLVEKLKALPHSK